MTRRPPPVESARVETPALNPLQNRYRLFLRVGTRRGRLGLYRPALAPRSRRRSIRQPPSLPLPLARRPRLPVVFLRPRTRSPSGRAAPPLDHPARGSRSDHRLRLDPGLPDDRRPAGPRPIRARRPDVHAPRLRVVAPVPLAAPPDPLARP